MTLASLFKQPQDIPAETQANFRHLYMDIAWFGVLNGTAISFMAIYAARLGAGGLQIGLLNATPAIVSLGITLPAGRWLQKRPLTRAVFWTSIWHRIFYVVWIFLPFLLAPYLQVWALVALVFLMSIPGTALAIGFNAMFAEVVPPEYRSHVVGVRNALLALVFIITTLISGIILDRAPFPLGYQVVFFIGFVGAMMSSLHLYLIRLPQEPTERVGRSLGDWAHPGTLRAWVQELRLSVGLRFMVRARQRPSFDLAMFKTPFGLLLGLLFGFHLAQYLAIPIFPLFWVNELKLTDTEISMGNAVFYATVLLGSIQLARITARSNHKQVLVMGMVLMSLYPALTAVTHNLALFLFTSAVGGIAWSLAGGALSNYIYDKTPEGERPLHLAWYHLTFNGAILLGALCGPVLADVSGAAEALAFIAIGRYMAAAALWRWG